MKQYSKAQIKRNRLINQQIGTAQNAKEVSQSKQSLKLQKISCKTEPRSWQATIKKDIDIVEHRPETPDVYGVDPPSAHYNVKI